VKCPLPGVAISNSTVVFSMAMFCAYTYVGKQADSQDFNPRLGAMVRVHCLEPTFLCSGINIGTSLL